MRVLPSPTLALSPLGEPEPHFPPASCAKERTRPKGAFSGFAVEQRNPETRAKIQGASGTGVRHGVPDPPPPSTPCPERTRPQHQGQLRAALRNPDAARTAGGARSTGTGARPQPLACSPPRDPAASRARAACRGASGAVRKRGDAVARAGGTRLGTYWPPPCARGFSSSSFANAAPAGAAAGAWARASGRNSS